MRRGLTPGVGQMVGGLSDLEQRIAALERASGNFPDAPSDGILYGRRDGEWEPPAESTVTAVTPATNWNVTLGMRRFGPFAVMSVSITRLTSNVGATTGVIATVGAAGRGPFADHTQSLNIRSSSQADLRNTFCWYNAVTGEVTVNFVATWNVSSTLLFNATVFLGESP